MQHSPIPTHAGITRATRWRTGLRVGSRNSDGFTMVELIAVMVISAILLAITVSGLRPWYHQRHDRQYAAAAQEIWYGIAAYRADHHGQFPPAADPATLVAVPGQEGSRYVRMWPQDPRTGAAIAVQAGGPNEAPVRNNPRLVYAGNGATGYLVAYGGTGRPVFRQVVAASFDGMGPVG